MARISCAVSSLLYCTSWFRSRSAWQLAFPFTQVLINQPPDPLWWYWGSVRLWAHSTYCKGQLIIFLQVLALFVLYWYTLWVFETYDCWSLVCLWVTFPNNAIYTTFCIICNSNGSSLFGRWILCAPPHLSPRSGASHSPQLIWVLGGFGWCLSLWPISCLTLLSPSRHLCYMIALPCKQANSCITFHACIMCHMVSYLAEHLSKLLHCIKMNWYLYTPFLLVETLYPFWVNNIKPVKKDFESVTCKVLFTVYWSAPVLCTGWCFSYTTVSNMVLYIVCIVCTCITLTWCNTIYTFILQTSSVY